MHAVPLAHIEHRWTDVERAVDRTPEIDPWCSGPDWVVPVHQGFGAGSEPIILAAGDAREPGFALLARYRLPDQRLVIAGIEPLWGFACPLLGADVEAVAGGVARHLAHEPWDLLVVPGMPALVEPGSFTARVAGRLARLGPVGLATGIARRVADLGGGHDAWLSRRSSRFRRNLGQAGRRAAAAGVDVVDVSAEPGVFERLMAIESRSWKGRDGSGITAPDMAAAYRAMTSRLQARGRLRAHVARLEGRDVGYILGGVRAGIYRGLQLSYTTDVADLSIGHVLQHGQLRALCASGEATRYDLGMDLEYKARWADRLVPTSSLVIERR